MVVLHGGVAWWCCKADGMMTAWKDYYEMEEEWKTYQLEVEDELDDGQEVKDSHC